MTVETWRAIVGYEGAYEVSDLGNVRSLTRWVPYGRHKGMTYKGRPLRLTLIKNGYLTVKLAFAGLFAACIGQRLTYKELIA